MIRRSFQFECLELKVDLFLLLEALNRGLTLVSGDQYIFIYLFMISLARVTLSLSRIKDLEFGELLGFRYFALKGQQKQNIYNVLFFAAAVFSIVFVFQSCSTCDLCSFHRTISITVFLYFLPASD